MSRQTLHRWLLISYLVVIAASLVKPHDYLTWWLEMTPMLAVLIVLLVTYHKFPLTDLSYVLLWVAGLTVVIGAHYTYEEEPLFNWLREAWGLKRNYYDRVGHFYKGVVLAVVLREVLARLSPLKYGKWLQGLVLCLCLAAGAVYEELEFAAAKISGTSVREFLGTQGDVWDPQWDMLMTLLGGGIGLLLFSKRHDRQLWKQAR